MAEGGAKMMPEERKTDNITMRIWLEIIDTIVGPNGTKSILNYAHLEKYIDNYPPDNDDLEIPTKDIRNLYLSLLELFGGKGARALQLRVGREFIRISIKKVSGVAKAAKLAARLLQEPKKMHLALKRYTEQYEQRWTSQLDESRFEIREEEDYFLLIDRDNPMIQETSSPVPACCTTVGELQELMEWITGHKHKVEEIECKAMGDPADVFKIVKARTE